MATSWEASPDGLTWTFHLRDAQWSDGTPVTADDFVFGVQRILDPKSASYSAFLLSLFLKNASQVNAGKLPLSAAGIEAPDLHTVVIHLAHPWPDLPKYTSGRIMWPQPRRVVERWGDAWTQPGHYISNGPYILKSWKLGDSVVVARNPRYWDAGKVCYDQIVYTPTTDAIVNERSVKVGDLDVSTTVQSNRIAYLRHTPLAPFLRVAPQYGTTYLTFNLHDPALKDVRVRQALSMAIDRDFITKKLLRGGQVSAYSFVPEGMAGYAPATTYWAGWSFARRQAEARRLLAAAGYGPGHPLSFTVTHRNSADPLLFLPAIQADWKAIGVDAKLQQDDVQVAYQEYEIHAFQVGDAGWVSEDPIIYLDLDRSGDGGQNYGGYANPAYDHELDLAEAEPDPVRRAQHLHAAETMLLADAVIAPLYYISSRNLVAPPVTGWVNNPIDQHEVGWLCRTPLSRPAGVAAAAQ